MDSKLERSLEILMEMDLDLGLAGETPPRSVSGLARQDRDCNIHSGPLYTYTGVCSTWDGGGGGPLKGRFQMERRKYFSESASSCNCFPVGWQDTM